MQHEIREFLRVLAVERNASPHTLDAYARDLEQFREFLAATDNTGSLADITHVMIRRWIASLHGSNARSTIGRKVAAVRSFMRHFQRIGALANNPAELVSSPKRDKKLPHHLTIDEVTDLVTAPKGSGPLILRDCAILETLYSSGLRVSELTSLDRCSLDLEQRLVICWEMT